jgi:glutamate-1-semialdehyde 2,1-aminomutase
VNKKLDRSKFLTEKARKLIPSQTGTFSRAASSFVEGVYPAYAESASGSYFTDVDGNTYLDYLCGLGPITLGYNYQRVDDAIIKQLKQGILFSLPHPIEVELSELISKIIPHAEMVKFEKTGSNAVTAAVRVARAFTKKEKIAYCGSGGVWHDWQAAMVSRDGGVPTFNRDLIKIFDYNDSEGLSQIFEDNKHEIAAIVLEPTHFEKPENDFLQHVRKIADENNSLLILDEIVTGFRFDLGGAQKFFNIKGDLVCFGKGMSNGLPISAITGPEEFMNTFDKLWVSSSNNMEVLSMAGCLATINEMQEKKTIECCWNIGKKLFDGWNKITSQHDLNASMEGYPIRMNSKFFDSNMNESLPLKSLVFQEMVKKGFFISPLNAIYLSYSHSSEDIEQTLSAFDEVLNELSKKIKNENFSALLEGNLPKSIWTMKIPSTKKTA